MRSGCTKRVLVAFALTAASVNAATVVPGDLLVAFKGGPGVVARVRPSDGSTEIVSQGGDRPLWLGQLSGGDLLMVGQENSQNRFRMNRVQLSTGEQTPLGTWWLSVTNPQGLAIGENDMPYVICQDAFLQRGVFRFVPNSTQPTPFSVGNFITNPWSIAYSTPRRSLLVGDALLGPTRLVFVSPEDASQSQLGLGFLESLNEPTGLEPLSNGDVLVVGGGTPTVWTVNPTLGTGGALYSGGLLRRPHSVRRLPSGDTVVVDWGGSSEPQRIIRINRITGQQTILLEPGPAWGSMNDFIVVSVPAPRPCVDLNGDGNVNTADLSIFLGFFGLPVAPFSFADFNGDGVVNTPDLVTFLGGFGATCQ